MFSRCVRLVQDHFRCAAVYRCDTLSHVLPERTARLGTHFIAIMEACPQCHRPSRSPHTRLVQDSCGHKKCRLCLMKDEDGCRLCAAKDETTVIKKEQGGKRLPIIPVNIRRHSQRKLLTTVSGNSTTILRAAVAENDIVNVNKKNIFKDSDERESDVVRSPEMETFLTDNENHDRRSDDSSTYSEETIKEKSGLEADVNLPTNKVECEEIDTAEVKLERKRKPMVIASHITVAQGNPTMYTCTVCVKTFKRREHVRYHNFCATGDKPFKCDLCGQCFASKSHFECHHLNHTGARPFVCETCNRGFRQKDKLTRHIRIHTGERPYVCQDCGKGFIASHSLKTHQRTHTGEKPYLCPHCGRGFTETVNLRKHILVHTGEKNFMCEGCGKSFGHKWALIHHQRTHSRERPHNCHICSRAFTNNKDLRRHFSVHSDVRPYKCSICDTKFRRKDNLERHMKNTHPETRITSLNLLNKNCNEHLVNTSNLQQQQKITELNGTVSNNAHHPTDNLEKVSDNIYKQTTLQETQVETFCMTTVPYSRTETQHTADTQESSCIKPVSRPNNFETSQTNVKLTSSFASSDVSMTTALPVSNKVAQKSQPQTITKCLKDILVPVHDMNITSFKEMLDPVHDTGFTNFKETIIPVQDMTITKFLEPARTTNIATFKDMLDPVHDMSIAGFKEMSDQIRDTNVTSFKEMLDPVQVTNIFPSGSLFQQIPEAKQQKSQAVPVINRPITPSQQTISYGRTGKTNAGKEKVVMEGTNCVPTITKTSNVLHSSVLNATNYGHQNVFTIVSASSVRTFACKKSRKILENNDKESCIELASRTLQSDIHWRKRTMGLLQHQQEIARDSGLI